MADVIVLRDGPHDGRTAPARDEVTRVFVPSEAPGMLDVYETDGEQEEHPDEGVRTVFRFVEMIPADPRFPEILHPVDLPD